ncbi:MAG: hypothetical protein NT077_01485 [Candidatus Taylorbacteria bacterium]|nr:hypothetical protein [Candidatus Taylorbacteria bacterium]
MKPTTSKLGSKVIIILLAVLLLMSVLIFLQNHSNKKPILDDAGITTTVTKDTETEYTLHSENFEKYFCDFENNVGWTECMIEALDRASAEREWKQRKLEVIKSPQVNQYNILPFELVDEHKKIRTWRENFETGRDSWCEAKFVFQGGSGSAGSIASCELELELQAIKDLNYLHYDVIMQFNFGSGISDFEPTDADIQSLVKSNKTKRGCVWAGEACE